MKERGGEGGGEEIKYPVWADGTVRRDIVFIG